MLNKKKIRERTVAVRSVQGITSSMEMIAAAKLKKARRRIEQAHPYLSTLRQVVHRLLVKIPKPLPVYMLDREKHKVGLMIMGSELGLCGSLNANLFKLVLQFIQKFQMKNIQVELAFLGEKSFEFASKLPYKIIAGQKELSSCPQFKDIIGLSQLLIHAFKSKSIDALYVAYNCFVSPALQVPKIQKILPFSSGQTDLTQNEELLPCNAWDRIYEPNAQELLDALILRSIESMIYQYAVENFSAVQAARMCAMQAASCSANELLSNLKLQEHKLRQQSITQELIEIMTGAEVIQG